MYESIIIRCLLAGIGCVALWAGWPDKSVRAMNPTQQAALGIVFMCGMFAIIAAVFSK
jgi:hypothetical protein